MTLNITSTFSFPSQRVHFPLVHPSSFLSFALNSIGPQYFHQLLFYFHFNWNFIFDWRNNNISVEKKKQREKKWRSVTIEKTSQIRIISTEWRIFCFLFLQCLSLTRLFIKLTDEICWNNSLYARLVVCWIILWYFVLIFFFVN